MLVGLQVLVTRRRLAWLAESHRTKDYFQRVVACHCDEICCPWSSIVAELLLSFVASGTLATLPVIKYLAATLTQTHCVSCLLF